nr:hypothetical protein [Tanacetum cinerariifolium]
EVAGERGGFLVGKSGKGYCLVEGLGNWQIETRVPQMELNFEVNLRGLLELGKKYLSVDEYLARLGFSGAYSFLLWSSPGSSGPNMSFDMPASWEYLPELSGDFVALMSCELLGEKASLSKEAEEEDALLVSGGSRVVAEMGKSNHEDQVLKHVAQKLSEYVHQIAEVSQDPKNHLLDNMKHQKCKDT